MPIRVADQARDLGDDRLDLPRQRAAVGVAQHQEVGAARGGGPQGLERVLPVGLPAVEEVLGVVHQLPAGALQVAHAVLDHRQVLGERGLDHLAHVEVPALAHQRDHRRLRLEQQLDVGVVIAVRLLVARRAEGADLGLLERDLADAGEELDVLGVRARPAAFDVGNAEGVEALGDLDLVVARERDVLALGAVAQRGVVEEDLAHDPMLRVSTPISEGSRDVVVVGSGRDDGSNEECSG